MSYKRRRSESEEFLDHDDGCNAFNATRDAASDNEDTDEPASLSHGIIWFEEQNSSTDGKNAGVCDNDNKEFVLDEKVITKYFMSAVQSHNQQPKLPVEHRNPVSSDTEREHIPIDNRNGIGLSIKSWEPKVIDLPKWAVVASQQ